MTSLDVAGRIEGLAIRPFEAERDFEAAARLISDSHLHDGGDWLPNAEQLRHEWLTTPGFEPGRDSRVAVGGGEMLGLVAVDWRARAGIITHLVQLWVAPGARRRGIGAALLSWAEAHARESVAGGTGGPADRPHVIGGFGERDVPGHAELAAAGGYDVVRYFFTMLRPLEEPIPDAPLPPGLELRPVRPEDHGRIWEADVEAFRDHWEAAERTDEDFEGMFTHPDVDTSLWQVAWDGDEVAGSVLNWIIADENARIGIDRGWLEHVSVRRQWRGRGLAAALIAESLRVLRDRGMTEAALGVDAENPTGALRLYERLGFRQHRTARLYRKAL